MTNFRDRAYELTTTLNALQSLTDLDTLAGNPPEYEDLHRRQMESYLDALWDVTTLNCRDLRNDVARRVRAWWARLRRC